LYNGRVLLARRPRFDADKFGAAYFETDFASFLAWRDWSYPDREVFNGFGAGALRSADGYYVLGRMAAHTANAGRIYFPAGTPDLNDVVGQRLDLAASVAREVEEEVGLSPSDYTLSDHWTIVRSGQIMACFRILQSPLPAQALRDRIAGFLDTQQMPELDAVHLVKDAADLTADTPEFVRTLIEHLT
jgi:8-oxo-dGTP pyrophosphatase MutT (NUDIX family)